MKIKIERKENKIKKEKSKHKASLELILFVFSMCALTVLLIFGTIENKKIPQKNEEETSVFKENEIYDIFELDLLNNSKTVDGVSDFLKK
ncbi:MAG: hypothetical protein IJD42_01940 [Clostridia bacterium]|nr:hypothetical protein [Clostridia bacterium]